MVKNKIPPGLTKGTLCEPLRFPRCPLRIRKVNSATYDILICMVKNHAEVRGNVSDNKYICFCTANFTRAWPWPKTVIKIIPIVRESFCAQ